MRRIAWVMLVVLVVLTVAGCQWATWREAHEGPRVGVAESPASVGEYIRIGVGKWTDRDGRVHVQPVYVRADEIAPDGVRGPEGPSGPAGDTGRDGQTIEITPDEPPGPARPTPSATTYDARGGTYRRDITVVAPPWGAGPAAALEKVQPMQSSGQRLPSFTTRGVELGSTRGGEFLGGGLESAADVVRRGPVLLCVIGALAVLAGIVLAVWAKRVVLGLAVAAGGGALIAAGVLFEAYPWVLLIALAAVLVVGVWWLVDAKFAGKAKAALSAIVRGVEAAPQDAQAAVKDSIASAATATGQYSTVKNTISEAKTKAGVG